MNYDPLLKSIFHSALSRVMVRLSGSRPFEILNIEFPTAESRRPDLVARLANGTILHVEIQSSNDPTMPWRMLQYRLLLRSRFPDERIVQKVLYVGKRRLAMACGSGG